MGYSSLYKAYTLPSLNLDIRGRLYECVWLETYLVQLLSLGPLSIFPMSRFALVSSLCVRVWYPLKVAWPCLLFVCGLLSHARDPCQEVHVCSHYIPIPDLSNPPVLFKYSTAPKSRISWLIFLQHVGTCKL